MQNISFTHEAAKVADFPKFDPDPMGVSKGVAKTKVTYNLVTATVVYSHCTNRFEHRTVAVFSLSGAMKFLYKLMTVFSI